MVSLHLMMDGVPLFKEQIDGVLVAFINSVGMSQCIDYALSYKDFEKEK